MRCEDARADLAAWLDGELAKEAGAALAAHVDACAACRDERAALERAIESVRGLPRIQAPRGLAAGVFSRLPAPALCAVLEEGDLSAYLDEELPKLRRPKVQKHVGECVPCKTQLEALDDTRARVQGLPRVMAPSNLLAIVRARIEDVVLPAVAPAPAASPSPSRRFGRLTRQEPIVFPEGLKKAVQAASVAILAVAALSFARPNDRTSPVDESFGPREVDARGPAPTAASPDRGGEIIQIPFDAERTLGVLVDDLPRARTVLSQECIRRAITPLSTKDPDFFVLRGTVLQLRDLLAKLPKPYALEDPARVDELLPRPQDRVVCRNVVYVGKILHQDGSGVVIALASGGKLALPRSSSPRAEPANLALASEVNVQLQKRSDQ